MHSHHTHLRIAFPLLLEVYGISVSENKGKCWISFADFAIICISCGFCIYLHFPGFFALHYLVSICIFAIPSPVGRDVGFILQMPSPK